MTVPGVYSPEQLQSHVDKVIASDGVDDSKAVEVMLVAAFVSLTVAGVPEDVLSMLSHGDGRGRIAPNAFRRALRAALGALRALEGE